MNALHRRRDQVQEAAARSDDRREAGQVGVSACKHLQQEPDPIPVATPALPVERHAEADSAARAARIISAAITIAALAGIVALMRGCSPYAAPTATGTLERVSAEPRFAEAGTRVGVFGSCA